MKKLLLPLALIGAFHLKAQISVPNASFEYGDDPRKVKDWLTDFDVSRVASYEVDSAGLKHTIHPWSGDYFLKLTTTDSTINGVKYVALGTADIMLPNVGHPDSFAYEAVYLPKIAEDGYVIDLAFIKWDSSGNSYTVFGLSVNGGLRNGSHWSRRAEKITYFGGKPDYDSLSITIRSANPAQHDPNTGDGLFGIGATLLIDEFELMGKGTGVQHIVLGGEAPKLYPNPAARLAHMDYVLSRPGHVSLALYDIQGKQVRSWVEEEQGAGKQSATLDLSGLPCGLYFCSLKTAEGQYTEKLAIGR